VVELVLDFIEDEDPGNNA